MEINMENKKESIALAVFLILLGVVVSWIGYEFTDWDYVCNSWWLRLSKPYITVCSIKGYPLFP